MNDYLQVLLYAAMPALGNFFGGVLAEVFKVSEKTLSLALHTAAGIVLAVIGLELMPQALEAEQPFIPVLAFVAGSVFFVFLDQGVGYVQSRFGGESKKGMSAAIAIYIGVAIDLFSDGIMIGTGSTVAASLGLLLAIGQVPADIPEGFATIATFKSKGVKRGKRLLLSASFAIPIFLGATVGYWGVKDSKEVVKLSLLAFVAGILLTVSIEEMLTEAHDRPDSKWAAFALAGGFALFTLLAVYLEE
ncbi:MULTISPECIES: ZIP family metal transporter [Pontibacter]|uniref:ZIP family zinc transporter n=1 Tax=Pontibacter actiniarum TaxID=323450 RepID=A0A1X9YZ85_9BACT|nr:ZIP family metal transporter [Pontibacter actiniarum]ARS38054.1 ZIP family zinc transporter [Pontibacter actiniarum]